MSIAALIRKMAAAGAPPEAIALAVEAVEGASFKHDERKRKDRERKARVRGMSAEIPGTFQGQSAEIPAPVSPEVSPQEIITQPPILPPSDDGKGARAKRISEDWQPSPASLQIAAALGLTPSQTEQILTEFKNYWLSEGGQKARKINWDRTFQNRLADRAPRILRENARAGPNVLPLARNGKPSLSDFARVQDERINGTHGDDRRREAGEVRPLLGRQLPGW